MAACASGFSDSAPRNAEIASTKGQTRSSGAAQDCVRYARPSITSYSHTAWGARSFAVSTTCGCLKRAGHSSLLISQMLTGAFERPIASATEDGLVHKGSEAVLTGAERSLKRPIGSAVRLAGVSGADIWQAAIARWERQAAPLKGVPIVVQHKAFTYLIAWIGLKEVATLDVLSGGRVEFGTGDLAGQVVRRAHLAIVPGAGLAPAVAFASAVMLSRGQGPAPTYPSTPTPGGTGQPSKPGQPGKASNAARPPASSPSSPAEIISFRSPEGIRQGAAVMGVTAAYLESVASFYDLFHLEPAGRHRVLVCTNISCGLNGAQQVVEAFESELGMHAGETTDEVAALLG